MLVYQKEGLGSNTIGGPGRDLARSSVPLSLFCDDEPILSYSSFDSSTTQEPDLPVLDFSSKALMQPQRRLPAHQQHLPHKLQHIEHRVLPPKLRFPLTLLPINRTPSQQAQRLQLVLLSHSFLWPYLAAYTLYFCAEEKLGSQRLIRSMKLKLTNTPLPIILSS